MNREGGPTFDPLDPHGTLGKEDESKSKYPRYVKGEDGKFHREDDADVRREQEAEKEVASILQKNMSRRGVLKTLGGVGAAVAAGGAYRSLTKDKPSYQTEGSLGQVPLKHELKEDVETDKNEERKQNEKIPDGLLPDEQLARFGKIENLSQGLEMKHARHYEYLKDHPNDMKSTVENMHSLLESDKELTRENLGSVFEAKKLPQWPAMLIPAQETRWQVTTSRSGARGITGIMPKTAMWLKEEGYIDIQNPEDVDDPSVALKATAGYLEWEQENYFGKNNMGLCLHAYNGGWTLGGFTDYARENDTQLTAENFYEFVEEKMNNEISERTEGENFLYTLDERCTTLLDVAKLFCVPLRSLFAANPDLHPRKMVRGKTKIAIPLEKISSDTWRHTIFRKEFEMLYYVPEVQAKMQYLKEHFSEEISVSLPGKI